MSFPSLLTKPPTLTHTFHFSFPSFIFSVSLSLLTLYHFSSPAATRSGAGGWKQGYEGVPRRSPSFLTADLPLPFKHNFGPHFPQPSHHFPSPIHLYSSILSFKTKWVVQFLVVLGRSARLNNSWLRFCLVFRRKSAADGGERFWCEVGAASSFGSSSYFSFPTLFSLFFLPFCYSVRPATLVADFRPFSGDGKLESNTQLHIPVR